MAAKKEAALPKSDAAKADMLYKVREERLALQKQVDAMQALETRLKEYFINNLPKSEASGIAGKVARVQIGTKPVPQVQDWDKFYAHIKKTGNFELMQRRLNEGAVKERWENKKEVPGVGRFNATTVSCTAL